MKVSFTTKPPVINSEFKEVNMKTLEMWHVIDGEYVHLVQISYPDTGRIEYYTNGKKEILRSK